jgi:hypothetical protein
MARHDSNTIIKFADDTTVVGLITDNDETAYREEVRYPPHIDTLTLYRYPLYIAPLLLFTAAL